MNGSPRGPVDEGVIRTRIYTQSKAAAVGIGADLDSAGRAIATHVANENLCPVVNVPVPALFTLN